MGIQASGLELVIAIAFGTENKQPGWWRSAQQFQAEFVWLQIHSLALAMTFSSISYSPFATFVFSQNKFTGVAASRAFNILYKLSSFFSHQQFLKVLKCCFGVVFLIVS